MDAYIIGGARTAIGSFNGALAPMTAIDLGAVAIKGVVDRTGIKPDDIEEVIMGNLIQAGLGQNPARQAAMKSGVPQKVPAYTINKACGSGLKAVGLAGQSIRLGEADAVVAGGMEHMSNAPYVMNAARWGCRLGHVEMKDSILTDALTDAFLDIHMGITAENIVEKYGLTRQQQDRYAALSQSRAEKAIKEGRFREEIVPLTIRQKKCEDKVFDTDEFPRFGTTEEVLAKLKPAFKKDGTVTAGNASGINDGGAAVLVVSERKMKELKPAWAFKIRGSLSAGVDPAYMGLGPIAASKALLERLKLTVKDIELAEVNEAFAAVAVQVNREMGWDEDKVNVNGGAIALGHPVGASGARVLVTLMYEMLKRQSTLGLATLCIGGGQGIAMVVERVR